MVPANDPPQGDSSLHLSLDDFRRQLDVLQRIYEVRPLEEMLMGETSSRDRRTVAITFDDAYRGALSLGVPELVERDLPATVFVCPGLMGSDGFWWDLLAGPGLGGVERNVREHAMTALGGRQDEILEWAGAEGKSISPVPDLYRPGSAEEVEEAASLNGIRLGSHTWSHVNLSAVPRERAVEELGSSREWLLERGQLPGRFR